MKKIVITFVLIISALQCFSQTTVEEWNYVTKGYRIQKESGLDMKKGYEIVNAGFADVESGNAFRKFEFKRLNRIKENLTCAIIVIYTRIENNRQSISYYGIPLKNSSPEIWKLVNNQINAFSNKDVAIAYNWALIQFISNNNL